MLIVDLDPQGNASTGLGIDRKSRRRSTYDVTTRESTLREAIRETAVPRLHIVPSTMDLSGFELEIAHERDRAFRLRDALASLNAAEGAVAYTYVLVDCPPSLNLVTVNAMAAADSILVPLQCEFFALEGLSQLAEDRRAGEDRRSIPSLTIHGIVLTMYDARNNLSGQVVADVRSFMGEKVYDTIIPRNVRVSEAPSHGKPVLLYDLKCVGSQAYLRLASEIIQRERTLRAACCDACSQHGRSDMRGRIHLGVRRSAMCSSRSCGLRRSRLYKRLARDSVCGEGGGDGGRSTIAAGARARGADRRRRRGERGARAHAQPAPRADRILKTQSAQSAPRFRRCRA